MTVWQWVSMHNIRTLKLKQLQYMAIIHFILCFSYYDMSECSCENSLQLILILGQNFTVDI